MNDTKRPDDSGKKSPDGGAGIAKRPALAGIAAAAALIAILAAISCLSGNQGDPASQAGGTAIEQEAQEAEVPCGHDWTMTYKTVRHDAVTHTEAHDPVYESKTTYHTVCNECDQVIDGIADEHIEQTGHSGYSTNVPITGEVLVSEGYIQEVTDSPAYDETVPDGLVCAICGETRPAAEADTE